MKNLTQVRQMNKIFEKIKKFLKDPLFLKKWEFEYAARPQHNDQMSISLIGGNKNRGYVYKADCFMFVQDMYTGLIPYREEAKYPVKITPFDSSKEKLIAEGISNHSYSPSLSDGLRDFIQTSAHVLFQNGSALYEIVCKKNEEGKIEEFDLVLIQPYCIYKFFGNYYQFISWAEAKRARTRVRIIKIPSDKILHIYMPKILGGKRGLLRTLKRLWQISKEIHPSFHMEAMEKGIDTGFDFNEYIKFKYLETAKITKIFGWDQRQRTSDYLTEFNFMMSYIRHKRTDVIMRQTIIDALNETLSGEILNFGVKISIENLPTLEDIEKQKEELNKGNVRFMEAYESLKL